MAHAAHHTQHALAADSDHARDHVRLSLQDFHQTRIQNLDKMAVRKRVGQVDCTAKKSLGLLSNSFAFQVVITKKPQKEGEFWSDLASSYAITVEPIAGDQHQQKINSDLTILSEYEVPTDVAWEVDRTRLAQRICLAILLLKL